MIETTALAGSGLDVISALDQGLLLLLLLLLRYHCCH